MSVKLKRLRACFRREGPLVMVLPVVLASVLAGAFFHAANEKLLPVLETVAVSQTTNLMTQVINAAVDDRLLEDDMSYADFVTVSTDREGRVTSLTSNTAANSRFKRQVVETVIRQFETLDKDALAVPLGTLMSQPLLFGAGPCIRVEVGSVGDVTADYSHSFTSAGVNQTLHRVCLDIAATVYLFLPGEVLPVSVTSSVCVAETVIVGEIPDTYLNLEKGSG